MSARVVALLVTGLALATASAQTPPSVTLPTPASPTAESDAASVNREVRVAEQAFTRDARIPSWVEPVPIPEGRPSGPTTLTLADNQVRVDGSVVNYQHLAQRINDASALTSAGRVQVTFIPDYQRVVLHTIRIWRDGQPLDRLAGAQIRFLQRETMLEQYMYSGVVTASILLDDLRVGDTIELAYSTIGTNPVFGGTFSAAYPWDLPAAVGRRHVVLLSPPNRPIAWKAISDVDPTLPKPVESTREGLRVLTFDAKDLKAVKNEPLAPNGFIAGRLLEFSEYASWHDVATWGMTLFDASRPPDAERAALTAGWKALPSDEARVVAALEFVQQQIRYFSVSLGTSSHRPAAPDTVLSRRYGDCKDKSLLLIALLSDLGIHAEPALARFGNRTGFDDWLPSPLVFDHVIVAVDVDGTRHYLDPTRQGQHGKLDRMGQAHDRAQVLPLAPATTGLVRVIDPHGQELAHNDITESLTVDKLDGAGHLEVDQTLNGLSAELSRVRYATLTPEQIDTNTTAPVQRLHAGAKLVGHVQVDDDRVENRIRVHARFDLPTAMQKQNDTWTVRFLPSNLVLGMVSAGFVSDADRRAPVAMINPFNATYRFDLRLPDEVSVVGGETPAHITDAYFDWQSNRTFHGNHGVATASLVTLRSTVDVADLARMRDEVKRFDQALPLNFVVRASDVKKAGFLGIGGESIADRIQTRQSELVVRLGKSIDGGKLASRDLARAYCQRGVAQATLDHPQEARADGDAAVAAAPNEAVSLECRAAIRLAVHDFPGAIDDASEAIIQSADGGSAYFVRARAEFALGRYAAAIEDLQHMGTAGGLTPAYRDIWIAMAYRRSGQPLPAALAADATTAEQAPWPRPALSLFADRITPERLVELARAATGDEAELNATEADFLVGEYFLARGDDASARRAFTSARQRGVRTYVEYDAAGVELERLSKDGKAGGKS